MATYSIESAKYVSGGYRTKLPEAASESFKEGQFFYLVNGKVTEVANNGVVVAGMVLQDASTTTDTELDCVIFGNDNLIEMTVYEDGGGTNDVYAVTDFGVKYAVVVVSNRTCIDTSDTSYDALVVIRGIHEVGDVYPRVLARVIPAALQFGAAAT